MPDTKSTVVVIGGGYGGINVAKALDEHADVILVEPKDTFQHNVAALRALVEPAWLERIFLPYDKLLAHGSVRRDRAVEVDADHVLLASGARLTPDFVVLATGSTYPFPAKSAHPDVADAIEHYRSVNANLQQAGRVMLVGAGAVGLELAGEIAAAWPGKDIVLVDVAPDILPGPYDQRLRDELSRQLDEVGVRRVLGSPLTRFPDTEPGEVKAVAVETADGTTIEADIWFRCYGVVPTTDYLTGGLAAARDADGFLSVTASMRVSGFDTVFALGDITAVDAKKAGLAARQADVVAKNIIAAISGGEGAEYTPGPVSIILPLGPAGGAGQAPGREDIIPAAYVSEVKGRDMFIGRYAELFNVVPPAP
jgi:apoptosis-inducing factor 2